MDQVRQAKADYGGDVMEGGRDCIPEKAIGVNPEIMETFGPWILVSRKNRRIDRRHDFRGTKDGMHDLRGDKEGIHENRKESVRIPTAARELRDHRDGSTDMKLATENNKVVNNQLNENNSLNILYPMNLRGEGHHQDPPRLLLKEGRGDLMEEGNYPEVNDLMEAID
ncbi:hypothetical protein DITRI_Ditri16bG0105100 [Diplodiscus trichospermus]